MLFTRTDDLQSSTQSKYPLSCYKHFVRGYNLDLITILITFMCVPVMVKDMEWLLSDL